MYPNVKWSTSTTLVFKKQGENIHNYVIECNEVWTNEDGLIEIEEQDRLTPTTQPLGWHAMQVFAQDFLNKVMATCPTSNLVARKVMPWHIAHWCQFCWKIIVVCGYGWQKDISSSFLLFWIISPWKLRIGYLFD